MANQDWLNAPIATQYQPAPQGPQIPWDAVLRFAPWVLLAAVVLWAVTQRPAAEPTGVTGLRVLVVEETAERGNLSPEQLAIFNSVEIREQIEAANGQLVFLDADDKTRELTPEWQRLRDRIRTRPPVVVFANKTRAKEMPLPGDVDEFINALEGFK
jgi:hypothetical protein